MSLHKFDTDLHTYIPFVGVVEDRNDPMKLKRVRVRAFFRHGEDKTLIPTEDLPWARVNQGLIVKEGTHVKGYFEDPDMQIPVVTEVIIGVPEKKNDSTKGFNDPRTEEQLQNAPRPPQELKLPNDGTGVQIVESAAAVAGQRLNEPCIPRLARGEYLDDYNQMYTTYANQFQGYSMGLDSMLTGVVNSILITAQQKITGLIASLINRIPGASLFTPTIIRNFFTQPYFKKYTLPSTYSFPPNPSNPQYPYNNVTISESGHIQEVDDTPGAERINTVHRSGTACQYHPDGSLVTSVRKDNHLVVDGNDATIVRGWKQVVVEGSESVTVRGAQYIQVEGACQIVVLGDASISVKGDATQYIKGDYEQVIGGNFKQTVTGTYEQVITGTTKITYLDKMEEYFKDDRKTELKTGEWLAKFKAKSLLWQFDATPPISSQEWEIGTVENPDLTPVEANDTALLGPEFALEPTVQTQAIDNVETAIQNGETPDANTGYTILKTTDETGMFVG